MAGGTSCDILHDAFKSTIETNSQWVQNVSRLLRHNGFSEVIYSYIQLGANTTKYGFHNFLEDIKDIEHHHVFFRLRTRTSCLFTDKGRYSKKLPVERKDPALYVRVELKTYIISCSNVTN